MNIEKELEAYISNNTDNIYTKKSEIWKSLFAKRRSNETFRFCEMGSFLSTRSRAASGTGDMSSFDERLEPALEYLAEKLDKHLLQKARGSSVGDPPKVKINSITSNLAHLWNLSRVQDYIEYIYELKEIKKGGLDILEIGPGYGCGAHILISLGLVNSYTLVDLSENIGNSVYYLTTNHPDWEVSFIRSTADFSTRSKSLNFLLASEFDFLKKEQFDAVINTDSFGEMPSDTAKVYIQKSPKLVDGVGAIYFNEWSQKGAI